MLIMHAFRLLILFLLSVTAGLYAQKPGRYSFDLLRRLDSVAAQDVPAGAPGIATAVIENGRVTYTKCAGYADLTDSTLITPASRFNIASNGKQFTALAILQLAAANKLSLNDDIRRFFPDLFANIPDPITIQSMLTHTSGIRDCYDLWSLQGITWWKQSYDNQDVLRLMQQQRELNFISGSRYLYSNTNYILLALLIEKLSGKSFTDYMRKLFISLRMHHTRFEDDAAKIAGPVARAYFNFGTWTNYNWIWNVCGDGNLFSTLEDQIQWEKLVQGYSRSAVPRSLIIQSQQIPDSSRYGFGLESGIYKGIPYVFHEGATGAWKATLVRFPQKKLSFVTLTNTGKAIPSMQTRQMADLLLELPDDQTFFVTRPDGPGSLVRENEITGVYTNGNGFAFIIREEAGRILLKRFGRNDIVLEREAANIFHQKNDTAFKQVFIRNTSGNMTVTAYYINHAPYTLERKTADFRLFNPAALKGVFSNGETGATIALTDINDTNLTAVFGKENKRSGVLLSPDTILLDGYTAEIIYEKGKAATLLLNGDRIRKIRFTRVE
jgi:CubicO group peptidase (beta-lactamase class C family)